MSHRQHVRNLIGVLGGAGLLGLLLVAGMIAYYGPTGSYKLANVLLAPATTEQLRYQHDNTRYVFDRVEFLFRHPDTRGWQKDTVSLDTYEHMYAILLSDVSVADAPDKLEHLFAATQTASLFLIVRSDRNGGANPQTLTFQEVNILDDYYRVELHIDGVDRSWAYFKHPGVLNQLTQTMSNNS